MMESVDMQSYWMFHVIIVWMRVFKPRVVFTSSFTRVYLSIFAGPPKDEVLENIQANKSKIRGDVGRRLKNMKHIPDLEFRIDDSLDYAEKIDELLKK